MKTVIKILGTLLKNNEFRGIMGIMGTAKMILRTLISAFEDTITFKNRKDTGYFTFTNDFLNTENSNFKIVGRLLLPIMGTVFINIQCSLQC